MDLWLNLKSPIEEEAARQFEMIRPSISLFSCRDLCQTCGRRDRLGIYDCMTRRFQCADCIKREIIRNLEADMEWQKREKIFNMRRARLAREIAMDPRKRDDHYIQYRMRGVRHEEVPDNDAYTRPKDPFLVGGVLENSLD
jgi:hypothetical protein